MRTRRPRPQPHQTGPTRHLELPKPSPQRTQPPENPTQRTIIDADPAHAATANHKPFLRGKLLEL